MFAFNRQIGFARPAYLVLGMAFLITTLLAAGGCDGDSKSGKSAPAAQTPPAATVVHDASFTTDELVAKGAPKIDKPWNPDNYKAALLVIADVAKSAAGKLPRPGSPNSGAFFTRLTAAENLTTLPGDAHAAQLCIIAAAIAHIETHYLENASAELMPALVDLKCYDLRVLRAALEACDREKSATNRATVVDAAVSALKTTAIMLADAGDFSAPLRTRLAQAAIDHAPALLAAVGSTAAASFRDRIKAAADSETDPDLKATLQTLYAAKPASNAH